MDINDLNMVGYVMDLIGEPERWTQGAGARDKDDTPVMTDDDKACKWCLLGALGKAETVFDRPDREALFYLRDAVVSLGYNDPDNLDFFNDKNPHDVVLKVVNRAHWQMSHRLGLA